MKRFIAFILIVFTPTLFAAPKANLWPYWDMSNESNSETVGHQKWQQILDKYLITHKQYTLFKYDEVTTGDQNTLNEYVSDLSSVNPIKLKKSEQFAFWVNLYNALTVQLILDNYPVVSITKLGGWFSFGPWDEELVTVSGKELTLNDIEHRILRPIWKDPRTHYAVNCASLGCPNLQTQAYTSHNTESLLEKGAHQFINSDKGARFDSATLTLSSIYDWFSEDFGSENQLIDHLSKYRPELAGYSGDIRYEYDWALNEDNR